VGQRQHHFRGVLHIDSALAAKPEEIADWVWRIGSVPGSYLTGETIVISGGLVMR
jgi:hypothetical protein